MRTLLTMAAASVLVTAVLAYAGTPVRAEVIVTRDSLFLPAGCSPREAADIVVDFLRAANTGSEADLQRALAEPGRKPPAFRWLSVSGPEGRFVAHSPAEAVRYLIQRRREGESLQLRQLDVGRSWVRQSIGAGFVLTRQVKDLGQAAQSAHGKAEIHCPTRTIYVWSMGPGKASSCAAPPGWGPASPPLACARSGRAPTAEEIAPSYRSISSSVSLPTRCSPGVVEARLLRALRALNVGDGSVFAKSFAGADAGGSVRLRLAGANRFSSRASLATFAGDRYRAGVGLTLYVLNPPSRADGPYRLLVVVRGRDRAPYDSAGKLFVDCRTGLIRRLALPSVGA
jgi:hypothetical protein